MNDTPENYTQQAHPWILPDQGLPKDGRTCLVTVGISAADRIVLFARYSVQLNTWIECNEDADMPDDVIAWSYLPEPYKG